MREWTISDDDDDPAVDWLTWKPGTYSMKCVIELLDGASADFEFEQVVGWRTACWLVIGQVVQTHTHDSANPDATSGTMLPLVQHLFNIPYDTEAIPDTVTKEQLEGIRARLSYRTFHRYQCKFEVEDGRIREGSLRTINPVGEPGTTKISIGLEAGELLPYWNNQSFTFQLSKDDPEMNPESNVEGLIGAGGRAVSSYFALRVGEKGRNANWRLFGKDAPWIFSEIIFELDETGLVVTRLRTSVDINWQEGQATSGSIAFNNLKLFKRERPDSGSVNTPWRYTRKATLNMEGQLESFIMSASGAWPEPPLPAEVR